MLRTTDRRLFIMERTPLADRVCKGEWSRTLRLLRHVFTELPKAQFLAEVEALLPTRLVPAALARD